MQGNQLVPTGNSVLIGGSAGNALTSGFSNVAIGTNALKRVRLQIIR